MPALTPARQLVRGVSPRNAIFEGTNKVWPLWTVASIPGLKIWFDASQLALAVGAPVSPWPNLADSAKPGTIVGTPAPVISANKLNGQSLVRFTVSEGRLRMINTGIKWDYTIVYVARMVPNGYSAGRIITASYPPPNFLLGFWNGFEDVAYSSSGAFFLPNQQKSMTTNWHLYSSDAASSPAFGGTGFFPRLFSNGILLSTGGSDGSCSADDAWYDTFNISGYDAATTAETCDCEIAEVVFYNRKLPDLDRKMIEDYLRKKWGL